MQTPRGFLPTTLSEWLTIVALVGTWVGTAIVLWNRTMTKVNGLGGRVKKTETSCTEHETRIDKLEGGITEARFGRERLAEQATRIETQVNAIREDLQQHHLEIGTRLYNLEQGIALSNTKVQVRLTRLETVTRIEQKLGPLPLDQ